MFFKNPRGLASLRGRSGFTLIELLVVIAIIGIISVIAIALFSNVQADARDGKRKAELESISNVLEVNKTSTGYQLATAALFGGGVFPGGSTTLSTDPQGYPYCINTTASVANSGVDATWINGATPSCSTAAPAYSKIDGTTPAANSAQYKICTRLENRGTPQVFCRTNTQ